MKKVFTFMLRLVSVVLWFSFRLLMMLITLASLVTLSVSVGMGTYSIFTTDITTTFVYYIVALFSALLLDITSNWGYGFKTILSLVSRVDFILGGKKTRENSKRASHIVGKDGVFKNG